MVLDLQSDSIDEIGIALREIDFSVVAEGSRRVASGGPGSGYHFEIVEDETMTHERYFEQLKAYFAEERARG